MGQKVHPIGLRIGLVKDWASRWYLKRYYKDIFLEDMAIRKHIAHKMRNAAVSRLEIERTSDKVMLTIYTARPGIVIGRGGRGVEGLRTDLEALTQKRVSINVQEVETPELDAQLVAVNMAAQIENQIPYKRVMRQAIDRTMRMGAKGVKVMCSGRLAEAEIARKEYLKDGKLPLHTLRADIDYGFTEARTSKGSIGVKVWIYKGDIFPERPKKEVESDAVDAQESETLEDTSGEKER